MIDGCAHLIRLIKSSVQKFNPLVIFKFLCGQRLHLLPSETRDHFFLFVKKMIVRLFDNILHSKMAFILKGMKERLVDQNFR